MAAFEEILACFEDAALQQHLMRPRKDDCRYMAEGGRVFYAVDSNVFSLHLDPSRYVASGPERTVGYGEIFRYDSRQHKEGIAHRLGQYLFTALNPDMPHLVLAPINFEVRRIIDHYTHEASRLVVETHGEEPAPHLRRLIDNAPDSATRNLLLRAIKLDHPATLATNRLKELARGKRLVGSDRIQSAVHGAALATSLRPAQTTSEMIDFARRKAAWEVRLQKVGRSWSAALARDAEALTRLELSNERLAAEDPSQKLVYLTGDISIFEAGEGEGGSHSRESFSREYLRHPRAYIDEPDVLRPASGPEAAEAETIGGWLTVLLDGIAEKRSDVAPLRGRVELAAETKTVLEQLATEDPTAAQRIINRWSSYASYALERAPKSYLNRLTSVIIGKIDPVVIERLHTEIEEGAAQAWTAVLEVTAGARFALEIASPDLADAAAPIRETPRLVFEGRPALSKFLNVAEGWLARPESFDHKAYEETRSAVRIEDPSEYGDYIAHAYLLAQQMQFRTAAIFAELATRRAQVDVDPCATMSNGRESNYLEAYCGRLTVKYKEDLARPRKRIERALGIAQREREAAERRGERHDAAEERFEAERLVIRMTEAQFDWAGGGSEAATIALRDIKNDLDVLGERVVERIRELGAAALPPTYDRVLILRGLKSALGRCYRTGLGISLQLGDYDAEAERIWGSLKTLVVDISYPSQFTVFVIRIGNTVFSREMSPRHKRRELQMIRNAIPQAVLPYDSARYHAMIANAQKILLQP